jgi:hypothetical protein
MFLEADKVNFSKDSIMDSFGRVFFFEGRVFRGIYEQEKQHCQNFLRSELYSELRKKDFVPETWEVNFEMEEFAMIIEHEFIDKSEPHHWSFHMFKDAILSILEINNICNKFGYELKDAHPYNIFFKNNKPIFVDFGSITIIRDRSHWTGHNEFLNYCFLKFLIWIKGDYFLARKLLEDGNLAHCRTIPMNSIFDSSIVDLVADNLFDFDLVIGEKILRKSILRTELVRLTVKIANRIFRTFSKTKRSKLFFKRNLKQIDFVEKTILEGKRPEVDTPWKTYHTVYRNDNVIEATPRFVRIIDLVKAFAPDIKSSIDLAGNQGIFSCLLEQHWDLKRIIVTDYDETAIDTAYLYFRQTNSKIQPYLFNFMRPLKDSEAEFLKADVAFALAITHHLILSQGYLLPAILNKIAGLTNRYVAIEFMPLGLWARGYELPIIPKWYTLSWFRNEFENYFVPLAEEQVEENRILFIGKKKLPYSQSEPIVK